MKMSTRFAIIGTMLGMLSAPVVLAEESCAPVSSSLKQAIETKPAELLHLVESSVSASPACACEIVKTSIETTQADVKTIASIVEVASTAAPDKMRLIAQCAVAVAPDALAEVQAVLARLDPSTGKSGNGSKDAKDAKEPQVADTWNPLDFPGEGVIGPRPGNIPDVDGPHGPGTSTDFPPVVTPPYSTRTNFVRLPVTFR